MPQVVSKNINGHRQKKDNMPTSDFTIPALRQEMKKHQQREQGEQHEQHDDHEFCKAQGGSK